MGKMLQGPYGPLSGKVGGLVHASWKGIPTTKGYQPIVSNPQTAGQVAQRTKMQNAVAFASLILASFIKPLWDRFQSKKSGYNAFISRNIALFATALPSSFADLVASSGKMASTPINTVSASDGSPIVTVNWTDDTGSGFKLGSDRAYLLVISQGTGEIVSVGGVNDRSEEGTSLSFSQDLVSGDTLHCYLAFLRSDGSIVSVNSYLAGAVT